MKSVMVAMLLFGLVGCSGIFDDNELRIMLIGMGETEVVTVYAGVAGQPSAKLLFDVLNMSDKGLIRAESPDGTLKLNVSPSCVQYVLEVVVDDGFSGSSIVRIIAEDMGRRAELIVPVELGNPLS